jgi:hypothetical protein
MTRIADASQNATVIVGRCEYMLAGDGSVLHRLIGANTFLSCRDAQHPTPDEKTALRMLLKMEASK